MSHPAADCNLLFGVLALQMDFIGSDHLLAAMSAWAVDKSRPLGQILCEQGALTAERRGVLDALVESHFQQQGNNPQVSLAAVAASAVVPEKPRILGDGEAPTTLASASTAAPPDGAVAGPGAAGVAPRYRRLQSHARGGLGEVFVAEDTELHREVALKEILPSCADDPESRSRFIVEAEITGGLEHPGIVPVYGLGTHADGRPYYAMRFIHGDSLKKACERFHAPKRAGRDLAERRLEFRNLLRRFIDACNAVAYAHSRGVLHRDLKPANIMLGKFGETLIVDWGLAKAGIRPHERDSAALERTTLPSLRPGSGSDKYATQAGVALGTPAYMSPEQAAGERDSLGPATDIYSLGATLYVLLTGQRPYNGDTADDVRAQVRQGRFPPPRSVNPAVPPALDAVCRKAMAYLPVDRYVTALALAADVEHWLADEPVTAYAEPWTARAGRWARRHRTAVVGAAVLLVSAVVALSVTTVLVVREQKQTAEQKRHAEHNFELARDLSFHGVDLIASNEASFAAVPALQTSRKELLKTAARTFREYLAQQPNDPDLRQRTSQVYRYAANIHQFTNEVAAADLLYRDSITLQEGLVSQFPQEIGYRHTLAETLRDYSPVQAKMGRLRDAATTLRRAVEVAEPLAAATPSDPNHQRSLATSLLDLCGVEQGLGLVADSGKTAARAEQIYRSLVALPAKEGHPYNPVLQAAALNRLAIAQRETGKLEEAAAKHAEAVDLLNGLSKKRPDGVNLADILHFLARCRLEYGQTLARISLQHKQAEPSLTFAVDQWEKLAKTYAKAPLYREWLGVAYQARGQFRAEAKRADEARADLVRSRDLLEAAVKDSPELPSLQGDLGRTYLGLARLARGAGDAAACADALAKAAAALRFAVDKSPDQVQERRSLDEVRAEQAK